MVKINYIFHWNSLTILRFSISYINIWYCCRRTIEDFYVRIASCFVVFIITFARICSWTRIFVCRTSPFVWFIVFITITVISIRIAAISTMPRPPIVRVLAPWTFILRTERLKVFFFVGVVPRPSISELILMVVTVILPRTCIPKWFKNFEPESRPKIKKCRLTRSREWRGVVWGSERRRA